MDVWRTLSKYKYCFATEITREDRDEKEVVVSVDHRIININETILSLAMDQMVATVDAQDAPSQASTALDLELHKIKVVFLVA